MKRFDRDGKLNGWFIGKSITKEDGTEINLATFGDWKTGEKYDFKPEDRELTKEEKKQLQEIKAKALKEKERQQESAAKLARTRFEEATTTGSSAYLTKKQIAGEFGQRYLPSSWGTPDLLIPCRDMSGKLWGFQKIQEDGAKFFTVGQKTEGCFHKIGEINDDTQKIYIAEGFATGASIYMATGVPTIVAFNAANLQTVGEQFRKRYPQLPIIFCGDDDKWTIKNGQPFNPGQEAADEASSHIGAQSTYPSFRRLETKPTDFNDLHCLDGLAEVTKQLSAIEAIPPNKIIKTLKTGFHRVEIKGGKKVLIPCYDDLLKFFEKEMKYKLLNNSGLCFVWNGKMYEKYDYMKNFAHKHFKPLADNKMVSEFRDLVLRSKITPMEWWDDTTKMKMNFQNGVLDLVSKEFLPHSPDRGFRNILTYNYDAQAKCPMFEKFLSDIFKGDEELCLLVCEFLGYAMSNDDYWQHKALVLEGEGANGKSTLMNVAKALAGPENYTCLTVAELKNEFHRQLLDGKLFNMSEETPDTSLKDSTVFKNLSSGGETQVAQKFKNPYVMRSRAKLIFACNELPKSKDTTYGFIRRFLMVPFKQVFTEAKGNKDPYIEKKLKTELPGIFNLVMNAYDKMKARGSFSVSGASKDHLEKYKAENDPTMTWIKENVKAWPLGNGHDDKFVKFGDLFHDYKTEIENGLLDPLSHIAFAKKLAIFIGDYEKRIIFKKDKDRKTERLIKAVTRESGEIF